MHTYDDNADLVRLVEQLRLGTDLIDSVTSEYFNDVPGRTFTDAELVSASTGAALLAATLLHEHPELVEGVRLWVLALEISADTTPVEVRAEDLFVGDKVQVGGKVRTVTEAAPSYFAEIAVRFAEERQTHRYQPDHLLEVVRRPEFPG
jgi:hypothetical protein